MIGSCPDIRRLSPLRRLRPGDPKRLYAFALVAVLAVAFAGVALTAGSAMGRPGLEGASSARCQTVAPKVVKAIASGLNTRGISLRGVRAVRSRDYKRVFFVTADLQGPGLRGSEDLATWATNKISDYGLIFSADAVAREFSDWGKGPGFDSFDDGHAASRQCVRQVLR